MKLRTGLAALVVLLACASAGRAQQTIDHASVSGRVVDATGGVVPDALVTARHRGTNATRVASADGAGRFRFAALAVGPYELTVQRTGFATTSRELVLTAGAAFDMSVTLAPEGVQSQVTVSAETPVLESARSQLAATVSAREIRDLPLNGRAFLDIALLAPGVAPPNLGSTQLFAETSAVPGAGLSFSAQRNFSNSVLVDGLSANDDAAGLTGMPLAADAVEQVQVVTSGGQAELGRALGGYVSVVTRSGTNTAHGTAYGYFRDDALNARNALTGTRLPMSQQQLGASLGGPIRRDRTFFFGNVERRQLDQTGLTTIPESTVGLINARLARVGYPGQPVETGPYPNPVDTWNLLGKVDHAFETAGQLTLRYTGYTAASRNSRGAGGLAAPSASAGLDNRDHAVAVSHTLSIGTRTVIDTRVQLTDSDLSALPTDPMGPAVSIAGVASFGTLSSSPQGRRNRLLTVTHNIAQQRGAHALRGGIDVGVDADRIVFPRAERGSYAFSSLANFLLGRYNNAGFTQTFGDNTVAQHSAAVGLYAQDAWAVRPSLTLNVGLRYDLQPLESVRTDRNNLSPRLGFAWSPSPGGAVVVRGNAGLFFDRVPLRAVANALLSADNTTDLAKLRQVNVALSPGQAGAPVFPAVLGDVVPSVTLPNLTTMQRDLQSAYSTQASTEVERRLGSRNTVSVAYSYVDGEGLLMAINQNVPSCVPSGANNGCRPIAAYGNDSRYSSAGHSTTHSVAITLARRPSSWGSYRASYTWSRARNDVGEFFFSGPIDPADLSKDWGRADNDRRHMLVLFGTVHTPRDSSRTVAGALARGWQLSALVQAYSAAPFNITSGVTTLQGTAGRPIVDGRFIPRNAGVGDAFFTANLRVSRVLRLGGSRSLEFAAEVFNLTDAVNEVARNTTFGTGTYPDQPSPAFGQVTAVSDPRSGQLAVRLRF